MKVCRWRPSHSAGAGLALLLIGGAVLAGCADSSEGREGVADPDHGLKGEPLVVGFTSTGSGPYANPELKRGAEVAISEVNAAGGIDGRPLRLETCSTDGTPATSIQCANKFVAAKTPVVLNGFDVGIDAAVPVLQQAAIPIFGEFGGAALYADDDAVILAPPVPATFSFIMHTLKEEGVEKLVVALPSGPFVKQIFDAAKPVAADYGIEATMATTAAGTADYTAVFTAAMTSDADAVMLNYQESGCTDAIRAARTIGYKGVIIAGDCQQFRKELGPMGAGVYTLAVLYPVDAKDSVESAETIKQLDTYSDAMAAAGLEDETDSFAQYGFSTVMTFADAARSIQGEVTPESLQEAISTFQGTVYMGGHVDCVKRPAPGAACADGMAVLQSNEDGGIDVVGGTFITLADIG